MVIYKFTHLEGAAARRESHKLKALARLQGASV